MNSLKAAQRARQAGPVVGVIGWGVPTELVEAYGATMMRVHPELDRPTEHADALVGAREAAETRALLEPVLDGSLRDCAMLVVTRSHEWVYYFLKEAVRTGTAADHQVPPLHLHDFVASSEPALRSYNGQQVVRLKAAVERYLGVSEHAADWASAFADGNARRTVMRRLADLRTEGAVTGGDAVRFAAASAQKRARDCLEDAAPLLSGSSPLAKGKKRLLLLSSDDDCDGIVHDALEAAGAIVVAEDGEWGIRTAGPELELANDPLDVLVDATIDSATGSWVSPRERRLGWAMGAMERADIDAVVFAIPPSDARFGWDYPALRERAAFLQLPHFLLQIDARAHPAAASKAVAGFLAADRAETAA